MAILPPSTLASKPQSQQENGRKMESAPTTASTSGTKENQAMAGASSSKTDSQLNDPFARLTLEEARKASATPSATLRDTTNENQSAADDVFQGSTDGGVVRALPVPLAHTVSKEAAAAATATIEMDGETVQIQPKVETPAQLAERAMHSRFMREALDMVSSFGLTYTTSVPFSRALVALQSRCF
jgi:hypothetical protein